MKKVTNKTDYFLVEKSLDSQIDQLLAGLSVVPKTTVKKYKQAVIVGMGGSRLPAEIVVNALQDKLLLPVLVVSDYSISESLLTNDTLVIALSYSGSTEEVLSFVQMTQNKGCDIYTISAGGKLAEVRAVANIVFTTEKNPSKQPRYGVGYMIGALLGLMQSLGLVNISLPEIESSIKNSAKHSKQLKSQLLKIASRLKNKLPVFIAAEHLSGLATLMQNQIHETSKNFACHFLLPNLNHHLLEGLAGPKTITSKLHFIIFTSSLYFNRNVLRTKLTAAVIKKQKINCELIKVNGDNKLTQAMVLLAVSGVVSVELAKQNKVDPITVPWVDYFKKSLK